MITLRKKMKLLSSLVLISVILLFSSPTTLLARMFTTTDPNVKFSVVKKNAGKADIFTIVDGKKYFIDTIFWKRGVGCLDDCDEGPAGPILSPDGEYLFYLGLNGSGYESDGANIYQSDLKGADKYPVLGRTDMLSVSGKNFFKFGGQQYLVINEESSALGAVGAWVYDINSREMVFHASGELHSTKNGMFKYCEVLEENEDKPRCHNVTAENIVMRKGPFKFLSRYPTHGVIIKNGVDFFRIDGSGECVAEGEKRVISKKGKKVLVLLVCDDGAYEIYLEGEHGTIKKRDLKVSNGK